MKPAIACPDGRKNVPDREDSEEQSVHEARRDLREVGRSTESR